MKISVFDPFSTGEADVPVSFFDTLQGALQQADAVSLHVPLTNQTRNILGKQELAMLRRGAIVVIVGSGV